MSKTNKISHAILVATIIAIVSVSGVYAAKGSKGLTEDAKNAIAANDYAAFITAIAGTRLEEKFTKGKNCKKKELMKKSLLRL